MEDTALEQVRQSLLVDNSAVASTKMAGFAHAVLLLACVPATLMHDSF